MWQRKIFEEFQKEQIRLQSYRFLKICQKKNIYNLSSFYLQKDKQNKIIQLLTISKIMKLRTKS